MANARQLCMKLLADMDERSSYSNILLDKSLSGSQLSQQEKKFVSAMFYGAIERAYTLDRLIESYCDRPLSRLSSAVRAILRMGFYQLLYMDSVPDSAAVNESVALAKANKNPAVSGFVNAVLRQFIRDGKKLPKSKSKIGELALLYSCPEPLVKKWMDEYGEKACLTMLKTSLGKPPVTAVLNTYKYSESEIFKALDEDKVSFEKIENEILSDISAVKFLNMTEVEKLSSYKRGMFHVQDVSSMICSRAVGAKPGDTVLDLCSAPGGKAFTVAEMMSGQGKVLAFDLHENRVRLIAGGAKRLELDIISAQTNNAKLFSDDIPKADKILCDVPCSGLGVIRRKPEIKYKNLADFEALPAVQYDILSTSAKYLKAGGELVYSTCTVSKAENDEVIEKFLKENTDYEPCAVSDNAKGIFSQSKVTILPDLFDSDGFFIAKIRRVR